LPEDCSRRRGGLIGAAGRRAGKKRTGSRVKPPDLAPALGPDRRPCSPSATRLHHAAGALWGVDAGIEDRGRPRTSSGRKTEPIPGRPDVRSRRRRRGMTGPPPCSAASPPSTQRPSRRGPSSDPPRLARPKAPRAGRDAGRVLQGDGAGGAFSAERNLRRRRVTQTRFAAAARFPVLNRRTLLSPGTRDISGWGSAPRSAARRRKHGETPHAPRVSRQSGGTHGTARPSTLPDRRLLATAMPTWHSPWCSSSFRQILSSAMSGASRKERYGNGSRPAISQSRFS